MPVNSNETETTAAFETIFEAIKQIQKIQTGIYDLTHTQQWEIPTQLFWAKTRDYRHQDKDLQLMCFVGCREKQEIRENVITLGSCAQEYFKTKKTM